MMLMLREDQASDELALLVLYTVDMLAVRRVMNPERKVLD